MWNIVLFPVALIWFVNIIFAHDVSQRMQGAFTSDFALMTLMENSNINVMCSPVTAFLSLSKLMLAAKGDTLEELEAVLGYSQENVREIIPKYIKILKEAKGVVLILLSNEYILSESYQAAASNIFGSGAYKLDFKSGGLTSAFINSWVKRNTGGKINEIISPHEIKGVSSLMIISAITFKGMWKTRFRKMLVKSKFYTPTGYIKVSMLQQSLNMPYKRSTSFNAQLVAIPYKGDQSDFVLILPNETEDLKEIFKAFVEDKNLIEDELKSMKVKGVRVFLPEVNIECKLDITPTLRKLNMDNLFSGAGLSEMVQNQDLTLDKAIQSILVEITEFGTSTFYPTLINDMPASGYELTMVVDKPFIFIIRIEGEHLIFGLYNGITKPRTFLYQTTVCKLKF